MDIPILITDVYPINNYEPQLFDTLIRSGNSLK